METKQRLLEAATALIEENGGDPERVTARAVCERAGAGLGLINYYFGSKKKLLDDCVAQIIQDIVTRFVKLRDDFSGPPFRKLEMLVQMVFSFLLEHPAISRLSILSDMQAPGPDTNTFRTWRAVVPLVRACRPDLTEGACREITWDLICLLQQSFLQADTLKTLLDVDLYDEEDRTRYCRGLTRRLVGEMICGPR